MKKILIGLSVLLLMTGCDDGTKTLTCNSTSESNGITTNTKYDIKYVDNEVKYVTITYDYNQNNTNNKDNNNQQDGTNADTDGLTENNNIDENNNALESNEVVDGAVGDTVDTTINGITNTILDLAGIKNTYQNQMNTYGNIEGFSYKVDLDTDNEYKVIYEIDMEKIKDEDLARFNVRRDFTDIKNNYEDYGYTCK